MRNEIFEGLDRWERSRELLAAFTESIAALGPMYASIAAVTSLEKGKTAAQAENAHDPEVARQLIRGELSVLCVQQGWEKKDLDAFLVEVASSLERWIGPSSSDDEEAAAEGEPEKSEETDGEKE